VWHGGDLGSPPPGAGRKGKKEEAVKVEDQKEKAEEEDTISNRRFYRIFIPPLRAVAQTASSCQRQSRIEN
jgi:hypothetical protein